LFSGKKGKELEQNLSKSTRAGVVEDEQQARAQIAAVNEDIERIKVCPAHFPPFSSRHLSTALPVGFDLQEAVRNAKSLEEITFLEGLLKSGGKLPPGPFHFPAHGQQQQQQQQQQFRHQSHQQNYQEFEHE